MTALIRSAVLADFPELVRSFGLQPEPLLAGAGIDRRALIDTELRLPGIAVAELLEEAARRSGEDAFGVLLAERRQPSIIGPVGLLLREEPTVGDAVQSLLKYIGQHNEAVRLRLRRVDGQAVVSGELQLGRRRVYRQSDELMVGVLFRVLQALIGRHWRPLVCFAHEPPARRDVHHRLFGPRVDFRCNYHGVIFAWSDLERAIPGADPAFAAQARRYLDSLERRAGASFRDKVGELVQLQLSFGRCTSDRLAQQLGCDRRTLYRRLASDGTTFDAVLNEVRVAMAVRVLQRRDAGLAEAADLLGFSSGSAFSRWFLAAFGQRPSEWRRAHGIAAEP